MPLPMVHLGVARCLVDKGLKMNNLSNFYLGSISPDAIHSRAGSNRADKQRTHLILPQETWRSVGIHEYVNRVIDFTYRQLANIDNSFVWGYSVHLIVDKLWINDVYSNFTLNYNDDIAPVQEKSGAYYNDTDILDQQLFNESPWRADVWKALQTAEKIDFPDLLSTEEIAAWNERTLHWYDSGDSQHKNPVRYITQADICGFISACSEKITRLINMQTNIFPASM